MSSKDTSSFIYFLHAVTCHHVPFASSTWAAAVSSNDAARTTHVQGTCARRGRVPQYSRANNLELFVMFEERPAALSRSAQKARLPSEDQLDCARDDYRGSFTSGSLRRCTTVSGGGRRSHVHNRRRRSALWGTGGFVSYYCSLLIGKDSKEPYQERMNGIGLQAHITSNGKHIITFSKVNAIT